MTVVVQSHVLVAELLDFEVVLVVEDVIGLLLVDCFVELDDVDVLGVEVDDSEVEVDDLELEVDDFDVDVDDDVVVDWVLLLLLLLLVDDVELILD